MSCMAGQWNFDGRPVDREFLARLGESIDQYGPDGGGEYLYNFVGAPHAAYWSNNNSGNNSTNNSGNNDDAGGGAIYRASTDAVGGDAPRDARHGHRLGMEVRGSIAMMYRAFHTNKESRQERQPYVSKRGNVMTWDGRLDNREELARALSYELSTEHWHALVDSRRFTVDRGEKTSGTNQPSPVDSRQFTVSSAEKTAGTNQPSPLPSPGTRHQTQVASEQWPVSSAEKNSVTNHPSPGTQQQTHVDSGQWPVDRAEKNSGTNQPSPLTHQPSRISSPGTQQQTQVASGQWPVGSAEKTSGTNSSSSVPSSIANHTSPLTQQPSQVTGHRAPGTDHESPGTQQQTRVATHAAYTDVAIVMAAWEAWGTECFKKLIGDYSLAVWEPATRTLTMAKDFIGVRYLYYEILPHGMRGGARASAELGDAESPSGPCVWWCSRLEPLILLSGRQYEINEEYIAGYFAFHPANHITPYVGVDALPAGHYVQIRNGQKKLVQYWHFDPDKRITYKTDAEYEEHFRHVFFQSVQRRLRADAPIVAGLSGGRDSSAIVCVADELLASGRAETPRLDTYSRFTQDDPFQDDHKYLTIVEAKRGRVGHHFGNEKNSSLAAQDSLATSSMPPTTPTKRLRPLSLDCFSAHPGVDQGGAEGMQRRMDFMQSNDYRIILAGIGGDEVTGGVPNCTSELADLLFTGQLVRFVKRLKSWSLAQKRTSLNLLLTTARYIHPHFLYPLFVKKGEVWSWLEESFFERQSDAFDRLVSGRIPKRGLPSFRTNVAVVTGVSWELAHAAKLHRRGAKENCYDRALPFLDRDFLELLFAIPREQVLRPGQYRSLMRRAFVGILPVEILNRTRKAFSARRPAVGIQSMIPELRELFTTPFSRNLGFLNRELYLKAVNDLTNGKNNWVLPIQRTITLEMWLCNLAGRKTFQGAISTFGNTETLLKGVA